MKYWFKAKKYGYGWYPSTWQGALILISYIIFQFLSVFFIAYKKEDLFIFIFLTIISTSLLLTICFKKGEKLAWRWGEK